MTETRNIEVLTPGQQIVEAQQGRPIREVLTGLYEDGLTQQQIADQLGVNRVTIVKWTRELRLSSPRSWRRRAV